MSNPKGYRYKSKCGSPRCFAKEHRRGESTTMTEMESPQTISTTDEERAYLNVEYNVYKPSSYYDALAGGSVLNSRK